MTVLVDDDWFPSLSVDLNVNESVPTKPLFGVYETLFPEIEPSDPKLGLETIEYDKELKSGSVETNVISVEVLANVAAETSEDTGASAMSLTEIVNCFSNVKLDSTGSVVRILTE